MAQSIQLPQKEVGVKNANGTAMGPEGPTRGGLFSLTLTKERK
jgi:hypothetical protein